MSVRIEYSPLVLFEAAASATPFITVPVGNAEEIVRWTGGGVICPAEKDSLGYTTVDPDVLARRMEDLTEDETLRRKLGANGRRAWQARYNWDMIARDYERVLSGCASHAPAA